MARIVSRKILGRNVIRHRDNKARRAPDRCQTGSRISRIQPGRWIRAAATEFAIRRADTLTRIKFKASIFGLTYNIIRRCHRPQVSPLPAAVARAVPVPRDIPGLPKNIPKV